MGTFDYWNVIFGAHKTECYHPPLRHLYILLEEWGAGEGREYLFSILWASQVELVVRMHLPMQEMKQTQVQPPGREDPLETEMATHSSVLSWTTHGQRSLVGYNPWGQRELDTTEIMSVLLCTLCKTWHLTCTVSLSWMLSLSLFYVKKPEL